MRTKKRRGNKSAAVTLTEAEVIKACCQYAEREGFKLSPISYIKIRTKYLMPWGVPKNPHSVEVVMGLKDED